MQRECLGTRLGRRNPQKENRAFVVIVNRSEVSALLRLTFLTLHFGRLKEMKDFVFTILVLQAKRVL
jgi:hypothetical protein